MLNYRFTSIKKGINYWPCSRICQSTEWMLRIHQLYSRNFHGIGFKSFTKHVCYYCGCHSSRRLHDIYVCHRKYVKKTSLFNHMLRDNAGALSVRYTRILKDVLRYDGFCLGSNCQFIVRDICGCNRIIALDLRHAFRNSPTAGETADVCEKQIFYDLYFSQIRSFGATFCTAVLWTLSFLLLRYFASLVALLQLYVCMFIFCGFTFVGMVIVIFYVPESRNRSSEEIEKSLQK